MEYPFGLQKDEFRPFGQKYRPKHQFCQIWVSAKTKTTYRFGHSLSKGHIMQLTQSHCIKAVATNCINGNPSLQHPYDVIVKQGGCNLWFCENWVTTYILKYSNILYIFSLLVSNSC